MGARLGLRIGGLTAAVACALLVACGGGGGGGGSVTPPTATPIATPTLSPTSVTGSTTIAANVANSPATFTGVSNGTANVLSGGTVTLPTFTTSNSASFTLSGTLPSGVTAPSIRNEHFRSAKMLGVANTPIVYLQVTFTSNATLTASPNFVFNFPAALTGNAYVVVSGSTIPNGWNEVAGPGVYSNSNTTLTFAPITQSPPVTLNAGIVYTFALVTTGTLTIPTPTPVPTATPIPPSPGAAPTLQPITGASLGGGWSPYDVATAFSFPVQHGYNGQGETVAIIGDDPPAQSDITAFQNAFHITYTGTYSVVNVTGVSNLGADSGGQGEATLDVETVMGLAPGANITFYNTTGDLSNNAFLTAETQVANSNSGNGPDVFSISFGGCESPAPQPTGWPDTAVFSGMNAKGTAVTVSAGDEGDNCSTGGTTAATQYAFGVDYPGSDPNVFSVGGTETKTTLTNTANWNDTTFCSANSIDGSTQCAGGGGVSTVYPLPAYQSGLSGKASASFRNTPDLSMPAEGVIVYLGGPGQFAGTSWSAPEMGALMAELDEYCGGRPSTNPIAEFYTAFGNGTGAANFLDITTGNNEWHKNDTGVTYSAAAGYDNVSGIGVPYGMSMASTRCGAPGHAWLFSGANGVAQALHRDLYGEQRDTMLPFASRMWLGRDMGERAANESTRVLLTMRNTSTAASDEQTVTAALRSAGFSIDATFGSHSLIVATAPSSTVASYFRTSMHDIATQYGTRYLNASAITLPAAIAPYVNTVLADNLQTRHRLSHRAR